MEAETWSVTSYTNINHHLLQITTTAPSIIYTKSPPHLHLQHRHHSCNVQVLSLPAGSTLELRTGDVTTGVQKVTFCVTLVQADL